MEQNKITIKVMRRGALAALPKQMHVGDAGFDLVANLARLTWKTTAWSTALGFVLKFLEVTSC